jgi:bifunctional non-homologous end joining protein LigD
MLTLYNKKRNFKNTPEPSAEKKTVAGNFRFVVQKHDASHLHYDFRLQLNGSLKSWAVPKGPSMNPADKRLAVHVEDHPVSYINFSGTIPKGNYGAGTVEIWDKGTFLPVDEKGNTISERMALTNLKKGELKFNLKGKKLTGEFVLVQLKNSEKNWLLIKHKDRHAVADKISLQKKTGKKEVTNEKANPVKQKKLTDYYKPMLATPVSKAFDDKDWIFEIKWDGYRAIAECKKKEVKLYSRNGLSFLEKYPAITKSLQSLKHEMILDGEIVILNEANKPDFQLLQQYEDHPEYNIVYYVFDLLYLKGKDVRDLTLLQRKELLKTALPADKNNTIRFCDHILEKGIDFFQKAVELDLEGIMAKKADSLYHTGVRSKEWLKIKNHNSREAVIAGFTKPKSSRKHFGALILAERTGKNFTYIGHTGTGFTDQELKNVWQQMQPYISTKSPFQKKIKVNAPVTWLKPVLVAQIKFTEQTTDGMLRHPVYMGLRIDKKANEVNKKNEMPIEKNTTTAKEKDSVLKISGHQLKLTNLTKFYWPKEKITKGDLINYYDKMSGTILPYLKNRPLSLKRNPNGINDKGFYQKDAGENFPSWIKTSPVFSESTKKTVHYTICNDKASLIYLANLGCIEMNPWNSLISSPDNPTYLIIDIDPSEKNTFSQVIETARAVHEILEKAGATSYCKTSGATGLHIYVPLNAKYDYEHARQFGQIIATLAQEQLPGFTSLERSLSKRGNKIYIDYLQNSRGQTIASAYSVRPMPGAQVSAPLLWKEVKEGLHPSSFTIFNIEKRVKELGDIFYMAIKKGINIPSCLKKLGY